MPGHLAPGASETHGRLALPSVWPFAPRCDAGLLRPRLTSRPASRRRPFRHKTRPPQVRARIFPAQPPDLRRRPLVARASRSSARSPWSASPRIRFLFVGWQLRSPLPSAPPSRSDALRFARGPCDQVPRRTCTSWPVPMLGAQKKERRVTPLPFEPAAVRPFQFLPDGASLGASLGASRTASTFRVTSTSSPSSVPPPSRTLFQETPKSCRLTVVLALKPPR